MNEVKGAIEQEDRRRVAPENSSVEPRNDDATGFEADETTLKPGYFTSSL